MRLPFQKMINDIFSVEDFLEDVFIESIHYKCIVSPITDNISFSDTGLVDEENFTIDIKLPVSKMPKKNDKVKFRDENYKINFIEKDSANTSIKIHLVSLSKGV